MTQGIEQRFPQLSLYIAEHFEGDTDPLGFAAVEAPVFASVAEEFVAAEFAAAEPTAAAAPAATLAAAPAAAPKPAAPMPVAAPAPAAFGADLIDMLSSLDASFSETVLALIDARGLRDAEVYKRANISRQLFSNIRGDASYRPTKKTALALAIALELTLDETNDLLSRAGYTLSHSSKADVIVEYFITIHEYNLFTINEALFAYDQPLI